MSNKPGGYRVSFEGELCQMTFWGHINEQHAKEIMEKQLNYGRGKQNLLTICDLRNFESVSPEARKVFASGSDEMENRGTVMYGASFQARVVATLVMKAASLFSKKDSPIHFCATEAEGWEWINKRRQELLKEQPPRL